MGAVWMRVRAELRARWRAWLALALAFGIAGGAATAAAAGARRTETAYPRFLDEHDSFHVITGGIGSGDPQELVRLQRAIAALPQVERASLSQFVTDRFLLPSGVMVSFPEAFVAGDASGAELVEVNRAKVLRGRMFEPEATDEAVADFIAAERLGLDVGDRVGIMLFDPRTFEPTIRRPVEIVGVVAAPGSMPAVGQVPLTGLAVSPGFMQAHRDNLPPNEDAPSVRLKDPALIPAFIEAARAIAPNVDIPVTLPRHAEGVRRTLRFDVSALWILAALIGLSALVILGQALARLVALEGGDRPALSALGMDRAALVGSDFLRASIIGVAAAAVTVAFAISVSPLTPRGLARVVEPDPGVYFDWTVLGLGAGATILSALAVSIVPAIRGSRRTSFAPARPSRIAAWLVSAGAGPSAVAGTRLALEPGRGARAIPVRATIGGVAIALAAVVAAGSFTESLNDLIARPELYGFTWDLFAGSEDAEADAKVLAADPDVVIAARGGYSNVVIGGRQLIPLTYQPGTIEPTILEGRAPRAPDEIALGTTLLRSLGREIGDEIAVEPSTEGRRARPPQPFTIVGRTVVPPVFFQQVEPGESVALTLDAAFRLAPEERRSIDEIPHLIRYRPGVDLRAKIEELRRQRPGLFVGQVREPGAELSALSRSSGLPLVLTQVLLLMAVATLVHTLGSSIRARRRDLAILKTIGFVRRQVRATVAWQGTTLIAFALVVGVPLGIGTGRWSWRWFANTLGVVPEPVSPLLIAVVVLPVIALMLANVIAAIPARAAARTQPAVVLRTE